LRGTKFETWEGGQRVPFIVRWPGKVPPGKTCDELVTAMDIMPTFARLAGTTEPRDRTIDGKDISPLIFAEEGAATPHESFCYYRGNHLEAVRMGRWKLHFAKHDEPIAELYDLETDIGESHNVIGEQPAIVEMLRAEADRARRDLGDGLAKTEGSGRRAPGLSHDPKPLTHYDAGHPYIVACYDTPDTAVMCG
jgi:arylsulfatase A-like enzyme